MSSARRNANSRNRENGLGVALHFLPSLRRLPQAPGARILPKIPMRPLRANSGHQPYRKHRSPHFWLLVIVRLTIRRFAGLDQGLVQRLGLVVGRIGTRDRPALSDTNSDELLEPFLLE